MGAIKFNDKSVKTIKLYPNQQTSSFKQVKKIIRVNSDTGVETPIWSAAPLSIKMYACSYGRSGDEHVSYFTNMYKCSDDYAVFFTPGNSQVRWFQLNRLDENNTNVFTTTTLPGAAKSVGINDGAAYVLSNDGTTVWHCSASGSIYGTYTIGGSDLPIPYEWRTTTSPSVTAVDINGYGNLMFITYIDSGGDYAVVAYERNYDTSLGGAWLYPEGYEIYFAPGYDTSATYRTSIRPYHMGCYKPDMTWYEDQVVYHAYVDVGNDGDNKRIMSIMTPCAYDPNEWVYYPPFIRHRSNYSQYWCNYVDFGRAGGTYGIAPNGGYLQSVPFGYLTLMNKAKDDSDSDRLQVLLGIKPPFIDSTATSQGKALFSIQEVNFDYKSGGNSTNGYIWEGSLGNGDSYSNLGPIAILNNDSDIHLLLLNPQSVREGSNVNCKIYSTKLNTTGSSFYDYAPETLSSSAFPNEYLVKVPFNATPDFSKWFNINDYYSLTNGAAMCSSDNRYWLYNDATNQVWWCFEIEGA